MRRKDREITDMDTIFDILLRCLGSLRRFLWLR